MCQHLPLQDPPKFTQIWMFGLKRNHLATLLQTLKTCRPINTWLDNAESKPAMSEISFFFLQKNVITTF
jgi:hypothetical protein